MSGIAGIVQLDGSDVDPIHLSRMVGTIDYRGPDGQNAAVSGSVGFGHCALFTTPESLHEAYPMQDDAGRLLLTADVRLDNREELIRRLSCRNPHIGDGALILKAYETWDERAPEYLVGAFAFAIWDSARSRIFCARDHMGVKPFYYHVRVPRLFIFGSEAKAVLAHPDVPDTIDNERLLSCLLADFQDKEATAFTAVRRLAPGHALVVDRRGARQTCYWELDPEKELVLKDEGEYVDAFREVFEEAVRCRMRSAYPVGSHLSGGLDSSAVTCVARSFMGDTPLPTFSNIFENVPQTDERSYIETVLLEGGYEPHFVEADATGPLDHLDELFRHEDEPFISGNYFLLRGLNKAMADAGVRVGLDGFDGDTTLNHGYEYLSDLAKTASWDRFMKEASALDQRVPEFSARQIFRKYGSGVLAGYSRRGRWLAFAKSVRSLGAHGLDRRQLVKNYGIRPWLPDAVSEALSRSAHVDADTTSVTRPEDLLAPHVREDLDRAEASGHSSSDSFRTQHWRYLTDGLVPYALEGYDRLQAAAGIEVRHPFMDKRLVELSLSLPGSFKLRDGLNRWILRAASRHVLPEVIELRTDKANTTPNLVRGLTRNRSAFVHDALSQMASQQDLVDTSTLRSLYTRLEAGSASVRDVTLFWRGFSVGMWILHRRSAEFSGRQELMTNVCIE